MTEIIEQSRNEVVIKLPESFTSDEKVELEAFLRGQSDVKQLGRRMYAMDHAPQGTLGFIIRTWDLVVVLSETVKEAAPFVIPLLVLYLAEREQRKKDEREKGKEERQREDDNYELVPIADQYGRTIKFVKRPKATSRP